MLTEMTKVEIVGPLREFDDVISYIHRAGVLHIEDLTKKFGSDIHLRRMRTDKAKEEVRESLESSQVKINSFITALKPTGKEKNSVTKKIKELWKLSEGELSSAAMKLIESMDTEARDLTVKKTELEQELVSLGKYEAMFNKIVPLAKDLVALEGFNTIMLLVDKKESALLTIIRDELAEMTREQFQLIAGDIDGDTIGVIVVYNQKFAKSVQAFLWDKHVNEVRLPEGLADIPFHEAQAEMGKRRARIPKELEEISIKLSALEKEHGTDLVAFSQVVQDRVAELQVTDYFGVTDYTFIVQGWLPEKHLAPVADELKEKFGKKVLLEEMAVSEKEKQSAPIKYSNRAGVRSFEPIIRLFGTPKYGTVDPTPFVAFFFPLFFGVILGDMGYALVVMAFAFWLRRRYRDIELVQNLTVILTLASISSFFFGFVYGEFFGDLPHRLHLIKEFHFMSMEFPIDRQNDALMTTLFFAVALGGAHILLGLIIGMINAARANNHKHFAEKLGLIMTLLGLVALAISLLPNVSIPLKTPGIIMMTIALPLIIYGGGFLGVLEIVGTLGNVMSYARIMALGLVSVVLASLANQAGASFGDNLWIGILLAAFIHLINIIIHVFTPSIHALRLNFVEFYGKFYESGGTEYKPFQRGGRK